MSEKQKPYDAGDPDQVRGRKEKQKTRDLRKEAALRKFLSDPEGRIWMWDLLTRCGTFHLSFSTDALIMAFNEGRRDIGNHLISEINRLDAKFYVQMAVENEGGESESG